MTQALLCSEVALNPDQMRLATKHHQTYLEWEEAKKAQNKVWEKDCLYQAASTHRGLVATLGIERVLQMCKGWNPVTLIKEQRDQAKANRPAKNKAKARVRAQPYQKRNIDSLTFQKMPLDILKDKVFSIGASLVMERESQRAQNSKQA